MNTNMPIPKFRCSVCHYPQAYMLPGGKCPCGGDLIDIGETLKSVQNLWYEEAFETFPCVIAHEYKRLYMLTKTNNVYGAFLQLKDVIESTIKLIVLLAISWGKANGIDGREAAYEKDITTEKLSLGAWVELASMIKRFYKDKRSETGIPTSLWKLIDKLPRWVNENKLVNWRNEKLGHGAIGFEDSPDFQQEMVTVITVITDFYRANHEAFTKIKITSDNTVLEGASHARELDKEAGKCGALIDNESFSTESFIIHIDHGIYFFDEVIFRRQMRMLNYPAGKIKITTDAYTSRLYEIRKNMGSVLDASIESEFLTRTENDFLSRIGCGDQFVEPVYVTNWLRQCLAEHSKGVFLLQMERGCGKTCYSDKLNRRFSGALELNDDLDVRTYHLSRTQIGGLREFINGITSEWTFGYEKDPSTDLARIASLRSDIEHPEKNSVFMAEYLGKIQQYTSKSDARQRKSKIMLVLDGIDEIVEKDEIIWSFFPSSTALPDGVYILLTGRIADIEVSSEYYANHVKSLSPCSQRAILRTDDAYVDMLREYICNKNIPAVDDSIIDRMISASDYRILYLSLLCDQCKLSGLSVVDEAKAIIQSYLKLIESRYNEKQRELLIGVLSVLTTVGAYESVSLKEIAELNNMETISILLFDVMSDLLPLVRIERGFYNNGNLTIDANRYAITNSDVLQMIRSLYLTEIKIHVDNQIENIRIMYENNQEHCNISGHLLMLSHLCDVAECVSLLPKVQKLYFCLIIYNCAMEYNNIDSVTYSLVRQRCLNAFRQVIRISKYFSENEIQKTLSEIKNTCYILSISCEEDLLYEEAIEVLEYENALLSAFKPSNKQETALLYSTLGKLYGKTYSKKGIDYLQKAIEILSHEWKKSHDNNTMMVIADSEIKLSSMYREMNHYSEAEKLSASAIDRLEKIEGADKQRELMLCNAKVNMAIVLVKQKKTSRAEILIREVMANVALLQEGSTILLAYCLKELAELYRVKGEHQHAYELNVDALEIYTKLFDENKATSSELELDLAEVHNNLGSICRQLEKYSESQEHYEIALQIYEKYSKISPSVYNPDVAMTRMNMANLKKELRDNIAAEQHYQKAYSIYHSLYEQEPGAWRERFAQILLNLGMFYHLSLGFLAKAEPLYRKALDIYNNLSENNPGQYGERVGQTMSRLGAALQCMKGKEDPEACSLLAEGNRIMSEHIGIDNQPFIDRTALCNALFIEDVKYLLCEDSQMIPENGWCKESADAVRKVRQTHAYEVTPDYDSVDLDRQTAKYTLDQPDQVIIMRQIKLQYSRVMNKLQSITILAGNKEPECSIARQLKAQKNYIEAGNYISKSILEKRRLTTGTALEWFSLLAVTGDFIDAIRLVTVMSDEEGKGEMYHDDLMEELSCRRLLLYAGIEKYKGCDIKKFLGILSDAPETFEIDLDKVDTVIGKKEYYGIIKMVETNLPEPFMQLLKKWASVFPQDLNMLDNAFNGLLYRKVGRNDPCPCGSGKKYKKCHGAVNNSL